MFARDTNELVGSIAARKDENGVNLGYLLVRAHWGRGLMAEAVSAVTRWAFGDPNVFRVWAVCDVENRASARLLERLASCARASLRNFLFTQIFLRFPGIATATLRHARVDDRLSIFAISSWPFFFALAPGSQT
jgi:RimJ/RimL family protein N-acetyltransferase